ncbi:MAG: hypothetical protein P1P82_05905 [Bacteroidales bacterium]|nr:hypothetical protein [Bacteroidales bacterium]
MKYLLLNVCIVLLPGVLFAQDTTYLYASDFGITEHMDDAKYMRKIDSRSVRRSVVKTYEPEGDEWVRIRKEKTVRVNDTLMQIRRKADKLWPEVISRSFHLQEDGLYRFTDRKRGSLVLEGTATSLVPLHLEDTVRSYYTKNMPKSVAIYKNNKLIRNRNWLRNGNEYYDNLHYFVDQAPEHSLGQVHFRAYMLNGIAESGIDLSQISDRVVIGWVVLEDGSLEGFHTISGVFSQLNNILINLIREMPGEWQPAMLDGRPVRYYMNIPFNFIDRSERFETLELSTGFVSWD